MQQRQRIIAVLSTWRDMYMSTRVVRVQVLQAAWGRMCCRGTAAGQKAPNSPEGAGVAPQQRLAL